MILLFGLFAATVAALIVGKVGIAVRRATGVPGYWQRRRSEPLRPGDFQLVALGDSSVQSIGAKSPLDGYVGRIANYVAARTSRHVHVTNLADGGTTADVVRRQLPQVDLNSADLVIVADSNDLQRRVPVDRYAVELQRLIEAVPADRTVFSDLPIWPGRGRYQAVLGEHLCQ